MNAYDTSSSWVKSTVQQCLSTGHQHNRSDAAALMKQDFGTPLEDFIDRSARLDYKPYIESICKDVLYEIVKEDSTNQTDHDNMMQSLKTLFDLALILSEIGTLVQSTKEFTAELAHLGLTDQTLPLILLEEAFDTQTISGCQRLFGYLESRFERLTAGVDGTKGKGIVLLRLSNELLRRLSKSEDTVFCGRILVFLSKSFPLSEKSGVNLRGEFNVENKTTYDDIVSDVDVNVVERDIEGDVQITDPEDKKIEIKLTDNAALDEFYPKFWSMQNDFCDPTRLFSGENMKVFQSSLKATLQLFKIVINEQGPSNTSGAHADTKKPLKRKRNEEESLEHYNPKYLTSRELFNLEIRDLVFRRHILVQSYILIDFLLSLTADAKKAWETEKTNKSLQFPYSLEDDDIKWAEDTKREISSALQLQKGMDGLLFSRTVESVLTREKNWVKWKANNCVSFERPPVDEDELSQSSIQMNTCARVPRVSQQSLGAPTLSKIWIEETGNDGLEGLMIERRRHLPDYRTIQKTNEGLELDMDFANDPAEKETITTSISSNTWKALRVASKGRFHLFRNLDDELSLKSLTATEDKRIVVGEGRLGEES